MKQSENVYSQGHHKKKVQNYRPKRHHNYITTTKSHTVCVSCQNIVRSVLLISVARLFILFFCLHFGIAIFSMELKSM